MRKILTTMLVLLSSFIAYAQENTANDETNFVSESKVAQLIETKGSFIKKEIFTEPGTISTIEPAMLTNIRTGEKEPYVIVKANLSTSRRSILDYDEIPAVIEALEYISNDPILNEKPTHSVELYIKTRDGIEFGVFIGYRGLLTSKRVWSFYIQHSKYVTSNFESFPVSKLPDFIKELKDAKALLDEKI